MISTKEIKIPKTDKISSEYIESHLEKMGLNVLRWAIVEVNEDFYLVNLASLE